MNYSREYFEMHGMDFPADVSGVSLFGLYFSGIGKDELMEPGAREFVTEGIGFAKAYLLKHGLTRISHGVSAIAADKAVLYRDESGKIGLMVRVTAFGSGEPDSSLDIPITWIGDKNRLWKYRNFAYFVRNSLYNWQYGGVVF